jgi:hypothetical protein
MIEVALDSYENIFNEWDPAPFKRRDIDPDLRTFFEECSSEISLSYPIAVAFFLPKGEVDMEKQEKCVEGLRNFFRFNRYLAEKQLRVAYRNVLKYLVVGISFLSIAVLFDHQFEKNVLSGTLGQGLFIGGWVFVWEAVSTLAFKNTALKQQVAEWERFLDAPIVFKKEHRPARPFE